MRVSEGPEFIKGHGTENDFIVLPDPLGEWKLTDARVRALCDRHRGFGADGVLRVIRASALEESVSGSAPTSWFMDYRNADGSVAEMCGNGVRVFAKYLLDAGWVAPPDVHVGTRSGTRWVRIESDGRITVDMGRATVLGESGARPDVRSEFAADPSLLPGLAVDLGNPHLACVTDVDIDALDLSRPPSFDRTMFPHGVNVEFVERIDDTRIRMRVYERGVGETRSCGTGTVAATVAALRADGAASGHRSVEIPGGVVDVTVTGETTTLTGPAILVGAGRIDLDWWHQAEYE